MVTYDNYNICVCSTHVYIIGIIQTNIFFLLVLNLI